MKLSTPDKHALRKRLRATRQALPQRVRELANQHVCDRVSQLTEFQAARAIAAFLAFDGELDIGKLFENHPEKRFYLPVLRGKTEPLRFAAYRAGDPLIANRYGIPEPDVAPEQWLMPRQLDLVLTPLVGFDESGTRLGMGGGYYDRSFAFINDPDAARLPRPYLLGLAYELQKCPLLPRQPWDIALNAVVTEAAIYRFDTP